MAARTRTAFLVDENWPEFQRFVGESCTRQDALFIPLNGERFRMPRYRWPLAGELYEARRVTARRSWKSRWLAGQGAARQRALLDGAEKLARAYAAQLTPAMTELVVAQSLLPFLWKSGCLGGRVFRVLMTRLPTIEIERQLDAAFREHPERKTLNDFRAPSWVAEAEAEALEAALEVVTPHAAAASMFARRSRLLPWILPAGGGAEAPRKLSLPHWRLALPVRWWHGAALMKYAKPRVSSSCR